MGQVLRIRPVDDGGAVVELEPPEEGPTLQDDEGLVDLDQSWGSLREIIDALGVDDVERVVDEEVDPTVIDELARAIEPYDWDALFDEQIIEDDDLPDDLEYVEPYYELLRALVLASSAEGAGWEVSFE